MTLGLLAEGVSIRRVSARISATDFDPLSARIELERLLGALDWSIPWLSPSAVLCIKRLPDPRPGTLRLKSGDLRPAAAWQQAWLAIVEDKVRHAVRPALGAAPADAEAVVFADRAELLACLALDWCEGFVSARWWWRALFGATSPDRAIVAALLEAPEYLPPVVERLAQARRTSTFAAQLSSADVELLTSALCSRFGLEGLKASFASAAGVEVATAPKSSPHAARAGSGERSAAPATPRPASPPWQAWLDEQELESLDAPARLFVGIALSLRRAPSATRSQQFERAWLAHGRQETTASPPAAAASIEPATVAPLPAHAPGHAPVAVAAVNCTAMPEGTPEIRAQPLPSRAPSNQESAPGRVAHQAPPPSTDTVASAERLPPDAPPARAPAVLPAPSLGPEGAWSNASFSVHSETLQAPSATEPAPTRGDGLNGLLRVYGAAVQTQLGGLFFLANLALALELYPDFTRPRERGLSLPIWDFMARVGKRLLDGPYPDPIWSLLQRLAGEGEVERSEATFTAPDSWPPPRDWESVVGAPPAAPPRSLDAWLEWLLPYLRARLCRGLGLASTGELAQLLLLQSARVHVSDAHVDVKLVLSELPIAVRRAGLDRDPGWLPSAGLFLAFHFD